MNALQKEEPISQTARRWLRYPTSIRRRIDPSGKADIIARDEIEQKN
jgi:hypothetical protein